MEEMRPDPVPRMTARRRSRVKEGLMHALSGQELRELLCTAWYKRCTMA